MRTVASWFLNNMKNGRAEERRQEVTPMEMMPLLVHGNSTCMEELQHQSLPMNALDTVFNSASS